MWLVGGVCTVISFLFGRIMRAGTRFALGNSKRRFLELLIVERAKREGLLRFTPIKAFRLAMQPLVVGIYYVLPFTSSV
jgi:hypothetical protein